VTICLVTDRRRCGGEPGLLAVVAEAVHAGIDLVQVREPDLAGRALADLVAEIVALARGSGTRVVVNDRLDVALATGAGGVHLRADSIGVREARQIVPAGFLVGRSVHTEDEARSAAGADYLIAGTVFPTASKAHVSVWLGAAGLRKIVQATAAPVLAIGGVTTERIAQVATAGAAGVAAIGLFANGHVEDIVASIRRTFDTVKCGP
jgi:thiamine-phosphate pyrophosphorylase